MDAVEDIKGRLSIEDVIGRYLELKKSGRNFKAISPFTNEKTASFMVSPDKQIWHDFSSGKGGNMFSFVMEMEGLDFKGALELLARQAGVDLSQYSQGTSRQNTEQKERLYEVLDLAAKFYQIHFSKNKKAYEYILKTRKYTKDTALMFRIGYSPNSGDALTKFLKSKGFTEAEIKRSGLATQRHGGLGDMFRGRIMIPLMDGSGRVIGFTARLLEPNDDAPKYINTPATPLYDKSRHLFGLHLAKEAIRKSGYAVVTEGNLDVIASHQAGVAQVVASAGTALTERQLKDLGRLSHDVRLAFDQDDAGLQAAERSIPIAAKVGVNLNIIMISGAKDPDELIQKDSKLWLNAVESSKYAVDWLIDLYKKQIDLASAQGKREFSDKMTDIIKGLADPVEQDHYVARLAKLIDVSADSLRAKLKVRANKKSILKRVQSTPAQLDAVEMDRIKTQNQLLAICLMLPEERPIIEQLAPEMLPEPRAQKLLEVLKKHDTKTTLQISKLKDLTDYAKMLVLLHEELYQGIDSQEQRYELTRLQKRLIAAYVKIQKHSIAAELRSANQTNTQKLLNQAKELDVLLKGTDSSAKT
ncbi:MAG TPA: DNA primase [Candidatus Saccharimonadales bacterium]|nr:DNA primase [Candidatus Saccharimonadales bacterium]